MIGLILLGYEEEGNGRLIRACKSWVMRCCVGDCNLVLTCLMLVRYGASVRAEISMIESAHTLCKC